MHSPLLLTLPGCNVMRFVLSLSSCHYFTADVHDAEASAAFAERERAVRGLLYKDPAKALKAAVDNPPVNTKDSSVKVTRQSYHTLPACTHRLKEGKHTFVSMLDG